MGRMSVKNVLNCPLCKEKELWFVLQNPSFYRRNVMKKNLALFVAVAMLLPGCGCRKKDKKVKKGAEVAFHEADSEFVDIPVADEQVVSYFDEDAEKFELLTEDLDNEDLGMLEEITVAEIEEALAESIEDDFFWVEDIDAEGREFKTVYFDFDKYSISADQEEYVSKNIELIKEMVAAGETPEVIIEGHACSSAGSRNYNLAISNSRAEIVAQRLLEAGISQDTLKVVGRGVDSPIMENGQPLTGDKEQQWKNRRVEVRIYS